MIAPPALLPFFKKMQCLSFIGRTAIYILADCVLEFPGGNEIAHLLGVFMRSFFSLSRYQIEHFQNWKRLSFINFMGF